MDALRRTLQKISQFLGGMTATQKLLIASLMVVTLMALFLVSQYAATPKLVPVLTGVSAADQSAAAQVLDRLQVEYKLVNGAPQVSPERRAAVYAQLGQEGALPADASESFDDLVDKLSPWNTASQNEAILLGHRQRTLEHTIGLMTGVQRAKVLIDVPKAMGLGSGFKKPTASVTVFMNGGSTVSQKFANAIASTVAGSISGLDVSNVRIIDGSSNKYFVVRDDDVAAGGDYLEMQLKNEKATREKLLSVFSQFIPDVRIAVTAVIDASAEQIESTKYLQEGKGSVSPLTTKEKTTSTTQGAANGGEAGANPNTGLDISSGGAGGGETHRSEESKETYDPHVGVDQTRSFEVAWKPERLTVAINVPREYIARIWSLENPESTDAPSNADLEPVAQVQLDKIKTQAATLIVTSKDEADVSDNVHVSMIPVPLAYPMGGEGGVGTGGGGGAGGGGGVVSMLLAGGMLKNVALGGMAAVSLLLMFMMVRKASKPGELPTAEELVGIPPALVSEDDEMVGEAVDATPTLAGLELDDDEVREAKLVEQVDDLIQEEPDSVVALINRWIETSP